MSRARPPLAVSVDAWAQGCVVGVSGGPDSTALLDLLARSVARVAPPSRLIIAHVNYRLRAGADRDEAWVRALAMRYELPCVVLHPPAPPRGANLQAWARERRYEFFARVARRRRVPLIAVAHTADDQAETVLWHLFRGAGLRGVSGMAALRPEGRGLQLARPLLSWSRAQVVAYLRSRKLGFRQDPSNRARRFTRNRIRAELLPCCEATVPGATGHVAAFAARVQDDEALLSALAERAMRTLRLRQRTDRVSWSRAHYLHLPKALRVRILRQLMERLGTTAGVQADHLNTMESLLLRGAGTYGLPGPLRFVAGPDRAEIAKAPLHRGKESA